MYQSFFKKLYHNVYARIRRNPSSSKLTITVSFTVDGKSFKATTIKSVSEVQALKTMAEFHRPQSIMAVVELGTKKVVYQEDFNTDSLSQNIEQTSNEHQTLVNNNMQQTPTNTQAPSMGFSDMPFTADAQFNGFGDVRVKQYVDKMMDEERKARRLSELEKELSKKKEEIHNLNLHISKQESALDNHEQEIEHLQADLEAKKSIRYWAGLTGDILESIGIKKESLKAPLAGFLTTEENQSSERKTLPDTSGIVEETAVNDKRAELIALIHEYLQHVDDTTLSNIFRIFSDIEQDKTLATYLIQQIKLKRQETDANI
jgi:hypothetical protein